MTNHTLLDVKSRFKGHLKKACCEEEIQGLKARERDSPNYSVNVMNDVDDVIIWLLRVSAHLHAANRGGTKKRQQGSVFWR